MHVPKILGSGAHLRKSEGLPQFAIGDLETQDIVMVLGEAGPPDQVRDRIIGGLDPESVVRDSAADCGTTANE
jgi:hypothetical protein